VLERKSNVVRDAVDRKQKAESKQGARTDLAEEPSNIVDNINEVSKRPDGTSTAQALRRLPKDRPDLRSVRTRLATILTSQAPATHHHGLPTFRTGIGRLYWRSAINGLALNAEGYQNISGLPDSGRTAQWAWPGWRLRCPFMATLIAMS